MTQDPEALRELTRLLEEQERRDRQNLFYNMFPDVDTVWRGQEFRSRQAYAKHMAFLSATGLYREVGMMASNRSGKTQTGAFAVAVWATGQYPPWWDAVGGIRFKGPVRMWVVGATNETTRDILQDKLFGETLEVEGKRSVTGTGMIPGRYLSDPTWRTGISNTLDTIKVKHASGQYSMIGLKSYQQGADSFMGTAQHVIWLDEEPPEDVAMECLTRTATTNGVLIYTFTPLKGVSTVARRFLPGEAGPDAEARKLPRENLGWTEITPSRAVVFCGWDSVPHLSEKTKEELLAAYPLHERDARTQGIPGLGDGAIYPIPVPQIVCDPFKIPDHWPRVYGMDVGWNCTAVVWAAWDRESDKVYVYTEHYRGQQPPSVHREAIVARGEWIPGVIDPASGASGQNDGRQLLADYRAMGLHLMPANNSVEAGILQVYNRLVSGRLVIFSTCVNLLSEYKFYRRSEGKVVKANDHALDALRYLIVSGLQMAKCRPVPKGYQPIYQAPRSGY